MNDEDKRANRRVPVALRIRLRYQEVDQFISKFAVNVSRGGLFLSSRNPKPIGTRLQFEMRLADESPVIEGSGEVRWIREYDRAQPNEPYGMGIQFIQLSPQSRVLIERIIEHRRSLGAEEDDEDAIPMTPFVGPDGESSTASASIVLPVDQVAARARAAAAMPQAVPQSVGETAAEPVSGPYPMPDLDSEAMAAPAEVKPSTLPPPPRKGKTIPPPMPPSPPQPPRRSARTTSDLVGYLGSEPPALRAALDRARSLAGQLAGGDLDRELALLLGDPGEDAVPEITIDAASRELAERLGGTAVPARTRTPDRSQPTPVGDEHTGSSMPIDPADILDEEAADDAKTGAGHR